MVILVKEQRFIIFIHLLMLVQKEQVLLIVNGGRTFVPIDRILEQIELPYILRMLNWLFLLNTASSLVTRRSRRGNACKRPWKAIHACH